MPAYTSPSQGGATGPQLASEPPLLVVQRVINALQKELENEYPRILEMNSCSHEFMEILDRLEEKASKELLRAGFKKIEVPASRERVDLPIGFYAFQGQMLVEIGIKGLNKCGRVRELTNGEVPRVYARIYMGGQAAYIIEAETKKEKQKEPATYLM
ncbi:hypothetical protein PYJP_01070 [Pyrofollis japonicus]|uniref:hypothetical protein n=1 Tax=Pyrofollis japonicus TaxID=3060460 RepID=UPI00295A5BEA|nr:hypothetical protein [Pyrofollis japonicus]BEP16755.1 hypothetical protein PYJP_01070 [Pyrofollis japonicus]